VNGTRVPALGPRGEGWVGLQAVALVAVAAAPLAPAPAAWPEPLRPAATAVGTALLAAGGGLAVAAAARLGRHLTPLPRPPADAELVEEGPFRWSRHPIYGGLVLAAFGWAAVCASTGALLAAGALTAVLELKARREEAWLAARFPAYAAYQRRTPGRLLPRPPRDA
jgi:protein-S-isoprenylcysteine O-methyltransferase Ste14